MLYSLTSARQGRGVPRKKVCPVLSGNATRRVPTFSLMFFSLQGLKSCKSLMSGQFRWGIPRLQSLLLYVAKLRPVCSMSAL